MNQETLVCNLCDAPGNFQNAREARKVKSDVRCFSSDEFTLWRCNSCRSLHSKEVVDLPRYYARYPFLKHTLNFHTVVAYKNRLAMLRRLGLKNDHSVLDFGCGKGLYVQALRDAGIEDVQGFDSFIPEFSNPAILERQYDVVVSHDVIEHVDDPGAFFSQLNAMVKPGGLLVIGTPNAAELDLRKERLVEYSQPYHRHILSDQALLNLGKKSGLTAEHVHRRFYYDTLIPSVNTRFMWTYIDIMGGMIDVVVEKLRMDVILSSPRLMFYALFGYFFRIPGHMLISFRKPKQLSNQTSREVAQAA